MKSGDTPVNWGVPDWRDAGAYPDPDDLELNEWRWEFLRRRDDYRSDYLKSEDSFFELSKCRYFEKSYFIGNPTNPSISVHDMLHPISTKKQLFPPQFDVRFIDTEPKAMYRPPWPEPGEEFRGYAQPYHLDLRVDLKQPLSAQFKLLRKLANDAQRSWKSRLRRPHRRKWPTYLRVLDGRATDATFRDIGTIVLRLDDYDEAAKRAEEASKAATVLQRDFPIFG